MLLTVNKSWITEYFLSYIFQCTWKDSLHQETGKAELLCKTQRSMELPGTQGPEQGGQHKGLPTVHPQTQQGEGAAVAENAAWVQDPSQRQEKRQTYLQGNSRKDSASMPNLKQSSWQRVNAQVRLIRAIKA